MVDSLMIISDGFNINNAVGNILTVWTMISGLIQKSTD